MDTHIHQCCYTRVGHQGTSDGIQVKYVGEGLNLDIERILSIYSRHYSQQRYYRKEKSDIPEYELYIYKNFAFYSYISHNKYSMGRRVPFIHTYFIDNLSNIDLLLSLPKDAFKEHVEDMEVIKHLTNKSDVITCDFSQEKWRLLLKAIIFSIENNSSIDLLLPDISYGVLQGIWSQVVRFFPFNQVNELTLTTVMPFGFSSGVHFCMYSNSRTVCDIVNQRMTVDLSLGAIKKFNPLLYIYFSEEFDTYGNYFSKIARYKDSFGDDFINAGNAYLFMNNYKVSNFELKVLGEAIENISQTQLIKEIRKKLYQVLNYDKYNTNSSLEKSNHKYIHQKDSRGVRGVHNQYLVELNYHNLIKFHREVKSYIENKIKNYRNHFIFRSKKQESKKKDEWKRLLKICEIERLMSLPISFIIMDFSMCVENIKNYSSEDYLDLKKSSILEKYLVEVFKNKGAIYLENKIRSIESLVKYILYAPSGELHLWNAYYMYQLILGKTDNNLVELIGSYKRSCKDEDIKIVDSALDEVIGRMSE